MGTDDKFPTSIEAARAAEEARRTPDDDLSPLQRVWRDNSVAPVRAGMQPHVGIPTSEYQRLCAIRDGVQSIANELRYPDERAGVDLEELGKRLRRLLGEDA